MAAAARLMRLHLLLLDVVLGTRRAELLSTARLRILDWYTNASLMEEAAEQSGIKISMLKKDLPCGGDNVPVTYAEFTVRDARPVDVFNSMLNTSAQLEWNPQCLGAMPLGDFVDEGVRSWAVIFDFPILGDREMVQWQGAEADFDAEEFWLVFSTRDNEELLAKVEVPAGTVLAQNCAGAYHITKRPEGAHVILTQHVNFHPPIQFSMHQVLELFPPAWKGTEDFVSQLSQRSRQVSGWGHERSWTPAPPYMLQSVDVRARHAAPEAFGAVEQSSIGMEPLYVTVGAILGFVVTCCCFFTYVSFLSGHRGDCCRTVRPCHVVSEEAEEAASDEERIVTDNRQLFRCEDQEHMDEAEAEDIDFGKTPRTQDQERMEAVGLLFNKSQERIGGLNSP